MKPLGTPYAKEGMMSDGVETGDSYRLMTCADCGNEYPYGGNVNRNPADNSPESAEHHAPGCPVRRGLKRRGQTADRDAHRDLGTDND